MPRKSVSAYKTLKGQQRRVKLLGKMSHEARLAHLRQRKSKADPMEDVRRWREEIARPNQVAPEGDWSYLMWLAGRGWGKTRSIAEFAREMAYKYPGSRGALVAATAADARDIVVDGESGILNLEYSGQRPTYQASKRRVVFPNGTRITMYSAEKPKRLRGPQHHWAICDELAAWERMEQTWDMLMFGLRLEYEAGYQPRCVIATTPRPLPLIKQLIKKDDCVVVTGTTYENRENLAPKFFQSIIKTYEGTALGEQELNAVILEEIEGALWSRDMIAALRISREEMPAKFDYVVTSVDPAGTTGETGIVTCGVVHKLGQGGSRPTVDESHVYVLADDTCSADPKEWGKAAINAAVKWGADYIIYEDNYGGRMVEVVLESANDHIQNPKKQFSGKVMYAHATKKKVTRAGPVSMEYEKGFVHHVGTHPKLEDQMATYVQGDPSPDRMDAMVWAVVVLLGLQEGKPVKKKRKQVKKAGRFKSEPISKAQF